MWFFTKEEIEKGKVILGGTIQFKTKATEAEEAKPPLSREITGVEKVVVPGRT